MNEQLKHKIGQMFSAGFPSPQVDEQARRLAEEFHVGNFYLFSRNIINVDQTCALCNDINHLAYKNNGVAPFIGVDQEGGAVSRIVEGASLIPGEMALAACKDPDTYQIGLNIGQVMRSFGITSPSSPVLDVNSEPLNPIIGARAYCDDTDRVSKLGVGMVRGLQEGGCISTVKHFPGHGNVKTDSHLGMPTNDSPLEVLESIEFNPFQQAFNAGADALMTAHVRYTAVDDQLPGTLSPKIMTDLLRNQMGFKGLAVTDCMEMDAIRATYGCGEGAVMAIEAGCDLLTFSHTIEAVEQAVKAIYAAVESGRITEERIDVSYNRIMALKKKYGLLTPPVIDRAAAHILAADPEKNALHQALSRESVTLLSDQGGLDMLKKAKKPLFLAPPSLALTGAEDQKTNPLCFTKLAVKAMGGEGFVMPLNNYNDETIAILEKGDFDVAVLGLYNARFRKGQIDTLRKLESMDKPLVVILLGAPYDATLVQRADALISGYEYTNISVPSILDAVQTGVFHGSLPVKL
ncbi:MAG: glycoside hydrolase family 3 protein [Clostridia bacterium]|nr:glycoside hydrolase family 3 protein [Clostridia bacterium]